MSGLSTAEMLCIYFGLDQKRAVKRKKIHDALVHRGVSVVMTEDAIRAVLSQIGYAADNRIPEIDDVNDPEPDPLFDAKKDYTFRLVKQDVNRCYDCTHVDIGFGTAGKCVLLDIAVANIRKSRCPKWEKFDEGVKYETDP